MSWTTATGILIRALNSSLLHIAPSDAILKPTNLERSKELWYGKQWFVGKVPRNYQKTCAHKESVPSSVPEYKVKTRARAPCPNSGVGTCKKGVFTLVPIKNHTWAPSVNAVLDISHC